MSANAIIHADHLSLQYGAMEVFSDLSFTIERGSFTSMVGPNGAGKTQLMRVMLGLIQPSSGMIQRNFDLAQVGYVPQKIYIDPTFPITVREFLEVYLQTPGLWIRQPLPEFKKPIAIEHLFSKSIGKLSGGQLQRVLLAAVLSTNPKLLFLDEFSAGVDPQGQMELYNQLHYLHEKEHSTIVMISHDLDITAQYADHVLCLNKQLICYGKPQDAFTSKNFEKMYGIPLTKLQHHQHRHG